MDDWVVIFVVFAAVFTAMLAAGWGQFLEHQRRAKAMDVIKAALEAGKDVPPELYAQLSKPGGKAPWGEVVVFTALSFGFWIAYAQADADQRTAFLVVAATMTVTALGSLGLALMHRGGDDKR